MNTLLSLYKATAESRDVARRVAVGSGVPPRVRISSNLAQRLHELGSKCIRIYHFQTKELGTILWGKA